MEGEELKTFTPALEGSDSEIEEEALLNTELRSETSHRQPVGAAGTSAETSASGTSTNIELLNELAAARGRVDAKSTWMLVAIGSVVVMLLVIAGLASNAASKGPNVIFFISDGTGPASITMARQFKGSLAASKDNPPGSTPSPPDPAEALALDELLVGLSKTSSASNIVTDSAAAATAMACGVKSVNGYIGVDESGHPVGSVLEAMDLVGEGTRTGVVVTSRLSHATPASFTAHVPNRNNEESIAGQQFEVSHANLMLGGGSCQWTPVTAVPSGCRLVDNRDLLKEAQAAGWNMVSPEDISNGVEPPKMGKMDRHLGLFADSHMPYMIDVTQGGTVDPPAEYPTLAQMTDYALKALDKSSPDGFFLMVEASRIDHGGHDNDAGAHLHEMLAYDEAVAVAMAYAKTSKRPTLIVGTSDHECGGLTLGTGYNVTHAKYNWFPEVAAGWKASTHEVAVQTFAASDPASAVYTLSADLLNMHSWTNGERDLVEEALAVGKTSNLGKVLGRITANRAGLAWTSTGHTSVDVNVYAHGEGAEKFVGVQDNTHFAFAIEEILGVKKERTEMTEWLSTNSPYGEFYEG